MSLDDGGAGVVQAALDGMRAKPSSLARALAFYAEELAIDMNLDRLMERVAGTDPNDSTRRLMAEALQHWDFLNASDWAEDTAPNTHERRARVYALLGLDEQSAAICDQYIPVWITTDPPIVIAEEHVDWYDPTAPGSQFFLPRYCDYLKRTGWSTISVEALSQVTASVVERISDPCRQEQYQSKGLVVGYVQSGKTANFTGVIARAADAGYRLFIVLAGTMDILRRQTQRRIDKELIGKELLEDDYVDDDEWDSFVSHGALPSQLGGFDWARLTGPEEDFQRLRFGIDALEFPKRDPSRPLYDAVNLQASRARIMVIKKHPTIIRRVARDLERITARLADIPALVIDDESDLASVNTRRPQTASQQHNRTATNYAIVELLKQLPRSQYIGYTATPFANVFIDPTDPTDLFPRDFLISLPHPEGYMGIADFHDLDSDPPGFQSNERAYVRGVVGSDVDAAHLPRALDTFVLTGAVKLFRNSIEPRSTFKHHTMLVHVSQRVADQEAMAGLIEDLIDSASYHSGAALDRLRLLWDDDIAPVSAVRANGFPVPRDFAELLPHIGECLQRLEQGKRVLVVNGTPSADTPDFDRQPIWKIICGGAKLSRGYTIEGLTVSYYRRRTTAADTLMQMGRWFGFREGYRDLVRLFIGRAEPNGRRTIDLYDAFEAVCRDEMEFRDELRRYGNLPDQERITPKQVPPLVPAHLLRPTASNKMYNAVVKSVNMSGEYRERTVAPIRPDDMLHNEQLVIEMLANTELPRSQLTVEPGSVFHAIWARLMPETMIAFLEGYRWLGDVRAMQHEIEFLKGAHGDPEVEDWLFLAPQIASGRRWEVLNQSLVSPFRTRTDTDRFGVYSEPRHRLVAEYIARLRPDVPTANSTTRALRQAHRGVLLFYPVHEAPDSLFTMGFALQFPENSIQTPIRWGVLDPTQPDAVVVTSGAAA